MTMYYSASQINYNSVCHFLRHKCTFFFYLFLFFLGFLLLFLRRGALLFLRLVVFRYSQMKEKSSVRMECPHRVDRNQTEETWRPLLYAKQLEATQKSKICREKPKSTQPMHLYKSIRYWDIT